MKKLLRSFLTAVVAAIAFCIAAFAIFMDWLWTD